MLQHEGRVETFSKHVDFSSENASQNSFGHSVGVLEYLLPSIIIAEEYDAAERRHEVSISSKGGFSVHTNTASVLQEEGSAEQLQRITTAS